MRRPTSGGWFLIAGSLGYFLLQWSTTTLVPSWYEDNALSGFWPATLGLHALTLGLLTVGVWLFGENAVARGAPRWLTSIALGLTFAGLSIGHPFLVAALLILSYLEIRIYGRWWIALLMSGGALLWMAVWLAGAHLGDEGSRPPQDAEAWIALTGLVMMSLGLVALGWIELETDRKEQAEAERVLAT